MSWSRRWSGRYGHGRLPISTGTETTMNERGLHVTAAGVAIAVLMGAAACVATVGVSMGMGLRYTWFPGGVVAFCLVTASTLLRLGRMR